MLKKLRLNGRMSINEMYKLMCQSPQLTHLGTGAFSPDKAALVEEQEMDLRSAFASLKYLTCLSGFKEMMPSYLPSIQPVCANLTSLNFSYADINVKQLKPIICHCHKLQIFWVLDFAVVAMSKNCPDLVLFRLCIMGRYLPDHLTGEPMDMGFGAIVMNCKNSSKAMSNSTNHLLSISHCGSGTRLARWFPTPFPIPFPCDTGRAQKENNKKKRTKFTVKALSNSSNGIGRARVGFLQLGNCPTPIETPSLLLSTRKAFPVFIAPDLLPSLPSPDSHLLQVSPLHFAFTDTCMAMEEWVDNSTRQYTPMPTQIRLLGPLTTIISLGC
ncbi:hypothetical protein IFM89_031150 [Coptis chinensis]|uniref:Uncharacterized protein n=1 Tax=Coptis chinensis TaxID=261450 RepID=A0A835ITF0_9MAGN|nr:hypothetical protein IFM89_031150 [Coptis chinensis]